MSQDEIYIKVAIIGSVGVGKTSIINRFYKDEFDDKTSSTLGVNYSQKKMIISNKNINMNIWDTAGQERFQSMSRQFYQNSDIIIIVYDMTKINSFEDIKTHWYNDVKENANQYKVLGIVGNKFDLYDNKDIEEIDENIIKEYINTISFENDFPIIHMKVSAKTGVNITRLFKELASKYLEKELHILIRNQSLQKTQSFKINNEKNKGKEMKKCC